MAFEDHFRGFVASAILTTAATAIAPIPAAAQDRWATEEPEEVDEIIV